MNTVACYKVVPDAQDIAVRGDGSLDLSRAEWVLGEYDLVAIEAAVKVAEATGGTAYLLSAGADKLTDTKLVKAALRRWPTPTPTRRRRSSPARFPASSTIS